MKIAIFNDDRSLVEYLYNLFYQVATDDCRDYVYDCLLELIDQDRILKVEHVS